MRKLIVIGALLFTTFTLFAEEVELTPTPMYAPFAGISGAPDIPLPGETVLYNDSGTWDNHFWGPDYTPYAQTFTAPGDCWLVRYQIYWFEGDGIYKYGDFDCYSDSSGTPSAPMFDAPLSVSCPPFASGTWIEYDLSGSSSGGYLYLGNGTVFHPYFSFTSAGNWGISNDDQAPGPPGSCWLYLGGWYNYPNEGALMWRAVVNDDVDPPYVDQQNPPDGGQGEPDTVIEFHVKDDDIGVDISTIAFSAEDESKSMAGNKLASAFVVKTSKGIVPGSLDIDDTDPNDVICTFTPDSDLPIGDNIFCVVDSGLADLLTNATVDDITWSFEVIPYNTIEKTSLGNIKTMFE